MLLLIFKTIDTIFTHFSGEGTWNFLLVSMKGISSQFAGVVVNLFAVYFIAQANFVGVAFPAFSTGE